ncbi:MAG: hypothetical protein UR66_C0024G0005 [Candidatus Moranbacteria bacterium GW2011_GWE1_35_17]|nr:MAG: hypothetical protein UR66_C0024G0005 [Candidatus Moranbacteria bacterium GW2011_GWE1_35_17]
MKRTVIVFVALLSMFWLVASNCVAEEQSKLDVKIILEDGSLYHMTEGDKAQWKFFIESDQSVTIKEVLIVFKSTKFTKQVDANAKRTKDSVIMYGTIINPRASASIIENAIAATRDALDN